MLFEKQLSQRPATKSAESYESSQEFYEREACQ